MNFYKVVRETKDGRLISGVSGLNPRLILEYKEDERTEAKRNLYKLGLGIFTFHSNNVLLAKDFLRTEGADRIYHCDVEEPKLGTIEIFKCWTFGNRPIYLEDLKVSFYPHINHVAICKAITLLERIV